MKAKMIFLGIAIGMVLTLTLGFAYGGSGSMMSGFVASSGSQAAMDAMHNSAQMHAMHARMPDELQARCDALHEQMVSSGMMDSDAMMGS